MKQTLRVLFALATLAAAALGQQKTISQILFSNATAPGVSQVSSNIGQSSHWLTYCTNSSATAVNIWLEGSEDASTWFQISGAGTAVNGCYVLQASGYFNYIRANLQTLSGTGATLTAYYTASVYPTATGGIVNAGVAPSPVTMVPNSTYINNSLSSSLASISATNAIVTGVTAYNPNSVEVFVLLEDNSQSLIERPLAPGASTDFYSSAGVYFPDNVGALCTTSLSVLSAPTTPCVLNVMYKPGSSLANQTDSGGTVVHYSTGNRGGL